MCRRSRPFLLFPYTTLFRSRRGLGQQVQHPGRLVRLAPVRPDDDERAVVDGEQERDRKSTRLNSSHLGISYAVFCLKKKTLITCTSLTIVVRSSCALGSDIV